jgi:hypothetical protein
MHFMSDENDLGKNYGSCTGPLCKYFAERCSYDLCEKCCGRIHTTANLDGHTMPWPLSYPGGNSVGFKPAVVSPQLPAHYHPVPSVPEPEEMQENTTTDKPDWMLGSAHTITYYCE